MADDDAPEASALRPDLLAKISHEIRTAMSGVIGMTELLLETELDTVQRDYAQTVLNSSAALLANVNDILHFSEAESSAVPVEDVDFPVCTILDEVMKLLRTPSELKGLTLRSVIDVSVPLVVRGDPGRLRDVLTDLIGKAVTFAAAGEVVIRLTCDAVDSDGATLKFNVLDTGAGVTADKVTVRVHHRTTSQMAPPTPAVAPRLLLVEDDAINEKVAIAMLSSEGYQVDAVRNGAEALAALEVRSYTAVLMDCQMPELNGYDAAIEVRVREGGTRHTPIIAMTADPRRENRDRCFASGMDAYLSKPVCKDALLAVVAKWVAWSNPARPAPLGGLTHRIETAAESVTA